MLQVLPSILARESIQAREKVVAAFIAYFNAGGHEQGSALIRARFKHSTEFHACIEDIARFEVGNAVAIMSNTTPSAFWALWHILSDATALEDCRSELRRLCKVQEDTVTLDITEVKLSCPMLLSTLQEVLRVHSSGISIRIVQEDHLLDGKYFLKKGATLMIPGPVQHTADTIYGESVNEFDHKRFVRTSGKRLNPMGFRGFGGGSTLCPGRHFASTEIIAFVALMVLRFDVRPKSGVWVRPTTHKSGMHAVVPTPDADVEVEVTHREDDLAGKRWNIILTGSDKSVPIVAEDVDHD
jgi:cytochrome P450